VRKRLEADSVAVVAQIDAVLHVHRSSPRLGRTPRAGRPAFTKLAPFR
jgi:hypothetical protein